MAYSNYMNPYGYNNNLYSNPQMPVNFNGIFTAPSTEATTINVQMLSDNVVVPDALAVATSASTTDYVNLAFTTLVSVKPSCCAVDNTTTLTFLNTNTDILFNANVVVTKIC